MEKLPIAHFAGRVRSQKKPLSKYYLIVKYWKENKSISSSSKTEINPTD